jgi:serine/threonine protein kinase/WD40 repeat protein
MTVSTPAASQSRSTEHCLADLIEELSAQMEAGEAVELQAYLDAHPEHAAELRRLYPALQLLADFSRSGEANLPLDGLDPAPALGTPLGDFRLVREIGRGGMGVVYEAEQLSLSRRVALKVLPFASTLDPRQLQRFKNEAHAAAQLHHTHIVPVYATGCERSVHFYAMEFIDGKTLADLIRELRQLEGREPAGETGPPVAAVPSAGASTSPYPLPPFAAPDRPGLGLVAAPAADTAPGTRLATAPSIRGVGYFRAVARLGIQAALALEHAHQLGVVHRDIKPGNLLVQAASPLAPPGSEAGGEGLRLWVTDFGLAQVQSQAGLTLTGDLLGTLRYMSPEQALAQRVPLDHRTDIYSLGVTLYELLTLEPAFGGRDRQELLRQIAFEEPKAPRRLNRAIPAELETLVLKAIEKNPVDRYGTAQELADDLRRFLEDKPLRAKRPTLAQRAVKWVRRHRSVSWMAVVALAVLAVGSTISAVIIAHQRDLAEERRQDAEGARRAARQSEADAKDQLFLALWSKARALRFSGLAGQRFDGLKALAEAARMARAGEYGEDQFLKLRHEAVACLALPDLRFERTLLEHVPHAYWIAFDPEFRYFAFSDLEGNLSIRRVTDGKETAQLARPEARPARLELALRFSPDGRWLLVGHASSGQPLQAALWEFRDGKPGRKVVLEHWCDFSPDSQHLAGARPDGSVGIYEVASGREVKRVAEGMGVTRVRFQSDGRQLAVFVKSDPRVVVVLDRETGKEVARYPAPEGGTDEVAWRGDGRLLAVPCCDQRIYVWDHARRRLQSVLEGHTILGLRVQFSHAGDFLTSYSWDGTTRLWDPVSGRQMVREPGSFFVAIRRDDRQVALAKAGRLELWEVAGGWECRTLHHGQVGNGTPRPGDFGPRALEFSPDGRLLASGSLDGARLWDLADFTEVGHLPAGPTGAVLFHPDGSSLFTNGARGLHRWPIRREMKELADQPDRIEVLQVGPPKYLDVPGNWVYPVLSRDSRGRWLSAVDYPRGQVIVLDLDHPGDRLVLEHPGVARCSLSPDGRWALTHTALNGQGDIKIWDTSDGKPVNWRPPAGDDFQFFTPDGRWLVTRLPGEAPLRFWQVGSWQPGPTLPNPIPPTLSLWPMSNGALLGLPSRPEPVWLIHAGTGKALATLEPPRDIGPTVVAVSPDGTRLAVGTSNHTIHVWDLRAIRRGLAKIGLDWDQPPYPPAGGTVPVLPLRVEVQPAKSAP